MGLTKQYLRYVPGPIFGTVASGKGGALQVPQSKNLVLSANAENVVLWNIKTEEKIAVFQGEQSHVSSTCISGNTLAVGYVNGNIRLFHVSNSNGVIESHVLLSGHTSPVISLTFDNEGFRLASGGSDTVVICWDVVNECGLFRLNGHKGPVTGVLFMKTRNVLVTCSKDSLIKFWDLNVKHCFKTVPGHLTELWSMVLIKKDQILITGSGDSELRVFKISFYEGEEEEEERNQGDSGAKKICIDDANENEDDDNSNVIVTRLGSLLRAGSGRTYNIVTDETEKYILTHGNDNAVEVFSVCSPEEIKKRLNKRIKKQGKKSNKENEMIMESTVQDEFRRLEGFKVGGKVRSLNVVSNSDSIAVLSSTANNLLEINQIFFQEKNSETLKIKVFGHSGHRSDVRSLSFSGDNTAIASVSHESLKVWNRSTQVCIRTIESGYGLCSAFVVGDRQIIVGTKKGSLQIFDLNSSIMTEEIENAHSGEIWSLCETANKDGFVTASADKTVKFWLLDFVVKDNVRILSLVHTRTLQLDQDVLSVKLSPDGRLLAVSLLDVKIKVFFVDSFKLLHDLFGHKLPSLAIDISHDSSILVSASADRNIKIWDLNHGQVEKSIFAHEDSIVAIAFVPQTHLFFSVSKDGNLKQWDADKFERILTLKGHHGEIRDLAISPNGKYVVTAGHDKTLRLWEKTSEPLVLEDERETERELEAELATGEQFRYENETDVPTKKTVTTERSAERLLEAIKLYREYQKQCEEENKIVELPRLMSHMYIGVSSAEDFMSQVLLKIPSSELEEALLLLSLDSVIHLLSILERLLRSESYKSNIETLARTFFFCIEIHFSPLSSSSSNVELLLSRLRDLLDTKLQEAEDIIGFNVASLSYMKNQMENKRNVMLYADVANKIKEKRKKKKRKEMALQTAIMTI